MAKIPCPIKAPCVDDANPFINLSTEAPDINRFFAYGSGPGRVGQNPTGPGSHPPPPGGNWNENCNTLDGPITCSATTLEEAILCVQRLGQLCAPPDDPQNPTSPPTTPPNQPMFYNTFQQCAALCPDGSPFLFQVPAGEFTANSQELADREALSYACRQAELARVCFGPLTPNGACVGTTYHGTIAVSTNFPIVNVAIISGSLPPGITVSSNPSTILFSGTPTTPGNYSFGVRAVNSHGNFMIKSFTIFVLAFTNSNPTNYIDTVAYSFQLTGTGGTPPYTFTATGLPTGLSVDSSGLISGTPSGTGTTTFAATMTDASGRTCTKMFPITGISGVGWKICNLTDFLAALTNPGCPASSFPAWNGIFNLETTFDDGSGPGHPLWYFLSQSILGQKYSPDDGTPLYPAGDWQTLSQGFLAALYFSDNGGAFPAWTMAIACTSGNMTWEGFNSDTFGTADPNDPTGHYQMFAGSSPNPSFVELRAVTDDCCPRWQNLAWAVPTITLHNTGTGSFTPNSANGASFDAQSTCTETAFENEDQSVSNNAALDHNGTGCNCNLHLDVAQVFPGGSNPLFRYSFDILIQYVGVFTTTLKHVTTQANGSYDFPFSIPAGQGPGQITVLITVANSLGGGLRSPGFYSMDVSGTLSNV